MELKSHAWRKWHLEDIPWEIFSLLRISLERSLDSREHKFGIIKQLIFANKRLTLPTRFCFFLINVNNFLFISMCILRDLLQQWAKVAALDLPRETSIFGASKVSIFLVMGVSKSLIAKAKKRNVQHERHPHAINKKMNKKTYKQCTSNCLWVLGYKVFFVFSIFCCCSNGNSPEVYLANLNNIQNTKSIKNLKHPTIFVWFFSKIGEFMTTYSFSKIFKARCENSLQKHKSHCYI